MSQAKSTTYIFCYLDVLGYKNLIKKSISNPKEITYLKDVINYSIFKQFPKILRLFLEEKYVPVKIKKTLKSMKISIISDTIMLRMPLLYSDKTSLKSIQAFLILTSFITSIFIGNVQLFLRGGISIGKHFEETNSKMQFMFSSVLVNAYIAEQKAVDVRIIFDKNTIKYLRKTYGLKEFKRLLYKDLDNIYCLDYYFFFNNGAFLDLLQKIIDAALINIKEFRNDPKVLSKYIPFLRYHNYQVQNILEKPEFTIDMNIFSKNVVIEV